MRWMVLLGALLALGVVGIVVRWAEQPIEAVPTMQVGTPDASNKWTSIGPSPFAYEGRFNNSLCYNAGRISSIAIDPSDPAHWLIGVGNGGVWRSRDSGASWSPLTDSTPTLATGAVAFAPSNPSVVYVGTGESAGGQSFVHTGVGVLKSTDGGQSWTVLGEAHFARASVKRLHVHPANPDVVVAATTRGGFGRDSGQGMMPSQPPFGIIKSTDGGASWRRTLPGQATALEFAPSDFNRQYAAIGDQRVGVFRDTPGQVNGVYRSTDGGERWSLVDGPWGRSTENGATVGRIELAIAQSKPDVLYVSIQVAPNRGSNATGLLGLYRTDNAWADTPQWIQVPTDATGPGGYCGPTKCGHTHVLSVDPADPDRLFAGGAEQGLWRCSNCGPSPSWTNTTANLCIHSDYHALTWTGNRLIVGNDGGVWSTTDFGGSWNNHNNTITTAMFYNAALHPTDPQFILAGLRDYQVSVRRQGSSWLIMPRSAVWGEAEVAISSSHPDTDWMGAWIWGVINRTTDGGVTITRADQGIDKSGAAFVAPVEKCPTDDNVFLTATNRIWRTNNFFNSVTPVWAANSPAGESRLPNALTSPGVIQAVAFGSSDPTCNTYAYGNRGGELRLTRDGGANWTDLDPQKSLPARPVNGLAFDPANPATLYIALSNFNAATPGRPGHIFKTSNALAAQPSWINVSPPIDVPFNVVAIDPANRDLVYAGSDTGLWDSADGGRTWTRNDLTTGLPPVSVYDIQINPRTNRTVVFTYGRGAYELSQ